TLTVTPLQQRQRTLQVGAVTQTQFEVARTPGTDVAHVTAEARFQRDRVGFNLSMTSSLSLYGITQAKFFSRRNATYSFRCFSCTSSPSASNWRETASYSSRISGCACSNCSSALLSLTVVASSTVTALTRSSSSRSSPNSL